MGSHQIPHPREDFDYQIVFPHPRRQRRQMPGVCPGGGGGGMLNLRVDWYIRTVDYPGSNKWKDSCTHPVLHSHSISKNWNLLSWKPHHLPGLLLCNATKSPFLLPDPTLPRRKLIQYAHVHVIKLTQQGTKKPLGIRKVTLSQSSVPKGPVTSPSPTMNFLFFLMFTFFAGRGKRKNKEGLLH